MKAIPTPEWLTRWEYAHRGLHSDGVPENSIAAIRAAIDAGHGVECDIQLSGDGVPIVYHDWDLLRLTGKPGAVADLTVGALEALEILGTRERPARLSRVLKIIAGKAPLLIEIKSLPDYPVERSCAAVNDVIEQYSGDVAIMSFDPRVGQWFATYSDGVIRGLVCTDTLDHGWLSAWRAPQAIEQAAPHFLAMDIRDLPNTISSLWRETGRPLVSWTIRSQELRAHGLNHADAMVSEGEGLA